MYNTKDAHSNIFIHTYSPLLKRLVTPPYLIGGYLGQHYCSLLCCPFWKQLQKNKGGDVIWVEVQDGVMFVKPVGKETERLKPCVAYVDSP